MSQWRCLAGIANFHYLLLLLGPTFRSLLDTCCYHKELSVVLQAQPAANTSEATWALYIVLVVCPLPSSKLFPFALISQVSCSQLVSCVLILPLSVSLDHASTSH